MGGEEFQFILRCLEVIGKLESHAVTLGASVLPTYPCGDLRGGRGRYNREEGSWRMNQNLL